MSVLGCAAIMLQGSDSSTHDMHLEMIFVGIIAASLIVQAIGVVIAGIFAAKLFERVDGIATNIEQRTGPILDKATALISDLTPKVQSLTTNVEQISYTVRAKVDELGATVSELNQTVKEINGRTRVQVSKVDGMVSDALATTAEVSQTVQHSIKAPVRQIAGVVAGVKAGVETLIARSPFGRGTFYR